MSMPNIESNTNPLTTDSMSNATTTPTHNDIMRVREFLVDLQARICQALEAQERDGSSNDKPATFVPDDWERPEGGGLDVRRRSARCRRDPPVLPLAPVQQVARIGVGPFGRVGRNGWAPSWTLHP